MSLHRLVDTASTPDRWTCFAFKRAFRRVCSGNATIKNTASSEPGDGLFPAFSASGQDIWLPRWDHEGAGIVLSAVGARCGKTFRATGRWSAIANTHVLRPASGFDLGFLWYVTNNEDFWLKGGTAQPYVQVSDSLSQRWPFPPFHTQRAIADFLDRKTAAIDALIEKKERLLELLAEKRAALIHRAVTKGLDPSVPMKDSGVPWIGEVPEHWEVWTVANMIRAGVLQIQDGNHGELHPVASDYVVEGIPFVMANNLRNGSVDVHGCKRIRQDLADSLRIGFAKTGDVLLSHKGTMGAVAVLEDLFGFPYFMLTPQVTYYRPDPKRLLTRFLAAWFEGPAFQSELSHLASVGSTRAFLGITAQRELHIVRPPVEEQTRLSTLMGNPTAATTAPMRAIRQQTLRLREYRQALITAAVTGQLDIEAAEQRPIPETQEQLGMFGEAR